jgi:hypothetical protein
MCSDPEKGRAAMKVLMVYTNTYRMFAPAPLGASLVASHLRGDGTRCGSPT